jgi:hypothetical protein
MLHQAPWLVKQLAEMRIREALRDAKTRRLPRQAGRIREGWPRRQVHHLERQLGYLLVELGVGLIERALFPALPATGQVSTSPCCGASP